MAVELYTGLVAHQRFHPKTHAFAYRVSMTLVHLNRLDEAFVGWWPLAGVNTWGCVTAFREANHMKAWRKPGQRLIEAVRDQVEAATGRRPADTARISLLTHLEYFGYCFNPISVYYVYGQDGRVETVVAEVSNTPWMEMHLYVLAPGAPGVNRAWVTVDGVEEAGSGGGEAAGPRATSASKKRGSVGGGSRSASPTSRSARRASGVGAATPPATAAPLRLRHYNWDKDFHVSPFMGMAQTYEWSFNEPGEELRTDSLNTAKEGGTRMLATQLRLKRNAGPLTPAALAWAVLVAFPLLTWRLQWWIHYEAVRLLRKGVDLFPHPHGATTPLVAFMEGAFTAVTAVSGAVQRLLAACGRGGGGGTGAARAADEAALLPPGGGKGSR